MEQESLFHEDIYDALRDIGRRVGYKTIGSQLWPEKSADKAGEHFSCCLSRDRREVLNPEQVLWLLREGRRVDCHVAMHYLADEAGYQRPETIEPEDEKARLQRAFIESVKVQKQIVSSLSRL